MIKINSTEKKSVIMVLSVAGLLVGTLLAVPEAFAQIEDGLTAAGGELAADADVDGIVANIVNILLYIIGAVAVIMIIFGGFQYVTSAGDPGKAGKARSTILYSVIGLILAAFAYAIANFVIERVVNGG